MREASLLWDREWQGVRASLPPAPPEREGGRQIRREPRGGALHQNKACKGLIQEPVKGSFWRFWAKETWTQICTLCYGQAKNNNKNSNNNKHTWDQAEATFSSPLPHKDDSKASRKFGGTRPERLKLPRSEGPILRPVSRTRSLGPPTAAPALSVLLENLPAKVIYFSSNIF